MASTLKKENATRMRVKYDIAVFEIELHFRPSCIVQCALCNVQCALYSGQCAACIVQRAVGLKSNCILDLRAMYYVQCVGFLV